MAYADIMGCVTICVAEQKQINMVLSIKFRAKIFDTEPFGIIVWRDDVDTDGGILFLEFRDMFRLHGKVDTVKVESVLVLCIVRNANRIILDRIQT